MSGYASADELLADGQLVADDVELPSGRVVRVRAITVAEVRAAKDGRAGILAAGMVEPALTYEQASAWHDRAPAGDPVAALNRIQELSGMTPGAAKATYKSVSGESGA